MVEAEHEAKAAETSALARRRPERDRLERLLGAIEQGSRLLATRRLKGGISTRTFDVRFETRTGERRSVVVRIFVPGKENSSPESVEREWRTLTALEGTSIAAPRPLFLDLGGEYFGAPCLVLSRIDGGPWPRPRHRSSFLRQLAIAIAAVHSARVSNDAFSHLGTQHQREVTERLAGPISADLAEAPLGKALWQALGLSVGAVRWLPITLTHRDYWPGNTVWYRRRLTGIVDWSSAELGDPRIDVFQCRVDLALMYGAAWADEFRAEYEKATNARLSDLRFWDLYTVRGAITSLHYFYEGYRDLGLPELTMEVLQARLDAFVGRALDGVI